jgi:hypothetical protein
LLAALTATLTTAAPAAALAAAALATATLTAAALTAAPAAALATALTAALSTTPAAAALTAAALTAALTAAALTAATLATAPTAALAAAFITATEKNDLIGNDFPGAAIDTFSIGVLPHLESALNVYLPTFRKVLATQFSLLAPNGDAMPLGTFLAVAITVGPILGCSHPKTSDGLARLGVTNLRISA